MNPLDNYCHQHLKVEKPQDTMTTVTIPTVTIDATDGDNLPLKGVTQSLPNLPKSNVPSIDDAIGHELHPDQQGNESQLLSDTDDDLGDVTVPVAMSSNTLQELHDEYDEYHFDENDYDDVAYTPSELSDYGELDDQAMVPLTREEQLTVIHDRAELDLINKRCADLSKQAQQKREEIKDSLEKIKEFEKERDDLYHQIMVAEETSNSASLYRLRAHHERIMVEIASETDVCDDLKVLLLQKEYEMNKQEVCRATFAFEHQDLSKKEDTFNHQKKVAARARIAKEEKFAHDAITAYEHMEKEYVDAMQQKQIAIRHAVEEANRNRAKVQKFINDNLTKIKKQEKEENAKFNEKLKSRMNMLLKLKADIATNRENVRSLNARNKALKQAQVDRDEEDRRTNWGDGYHPSAVKLIQRKTREWESEQTQFEEDQKVKKTEIIKKILKEEEVMKKKEEMDRRLLLDEEGNTARMMKPKPQPLPKMFDIIQKEIEPPPPPKLRDFNEIEDSDLTDSNAPRPNAQSTSSWTESSLHFPTAGDASHTLNKPEFEGLWQQHKTYVVAPDKGELLTTAGFTKMEKEILEKRLDKQRECIVTKQVVVGREFKGQAFYSKPDVIHFKDFDVGKTYKKKVILTNVSYSVNFLKYVGITEHLKDFIHIHFDPPGNMSAGMTCDMLVTFKPMINTDLKGEVFFMAQTGPITVPLVMSTKKCDLSLDTCKVDFGNMVIGETMKKSVTLTNKGAQGTNFEFCKVTQMKGQSVTSPATSLGRLTTEESMRDTNEQSEEELGQKSPDGKEQPQSSRRSPVDEPTHITEESEGDLIDDGLADTPQNDLEVELDLSYEDLENLDGMTTGGVKSGYIAAFSSIKLEMVWQPMIPGQTNTEFVVTFSDEESKNLNVAVHARAIDVPVWVERESIDMKICMYDRLYQDTLVVNNRATSALKLKFEVCKELRNHLEILPKTGYIQAQAQFSAQLKFLPRKSLHTDASKYFDKETGVLEVPLLIRVADQTRPVPFTMVAVVTNSDLKFSVKEIDFGCATIYECAKTTVQLSNRSILPQQFGFLGLPDYLDVQPNDGFGTLLPLETIDLDVIFKPKKAGNYKFTLACKSLINRDFVINCEGVGVHPPLELSHQVVNFAATSLYDQSTTSIHVCNSHMNTNEFTHPVPRIGKGEIAPVGPTSFEFAIPDGCPLRISPCVGTVLPGRECRVEIAFEPSLSTEDIKTEAVRIATKHLEAQAEREYQLQLQMERENEEAELVEVNVANSKKPPLKTKKSVAPVTSNCITVGSKRDIVAPTVDSIVENSPEYWTATSSLLRHYENQFSSYTIPCYVASGKCGNPGQLKYSKHNTLYVDIHCPVVRPDLVVISNNGNTVTDFRDISIGQTVTKSITIQNITHNPLKLTSSILHTSGPFVMVNAIRVLPPEHSHTLLMSFTPTAGEIFHETLKIHTGTSTLSIRLLGRGVEPTINLSVEKVLDMGAVLVGEYVEKVITLQNVSSLSVNFAIQLDSLSPFRYQNSQQTPFFLKLDNIPKFNVGTQNYNGQSVFDCVPCQGTIVPGATAELAITFAPDHTSDHYADFARIQLFGQEETYSFELQGMAKSSIMYMYGADITRPDMESLALTDVESLKAEEVETKPEPVPLLLTVYSKMLTQGYEPGVRQFSVGCVRTMAVSQKKSGEFTFDNPQLLAQKGFTIDPLKGMVEAGTQKPITLTWMPTPDHDPNEPVEASIVVTLRGDITEQYKLLISALVVS